jgi:hypothetical protein
MTSVVVFGTALVAAEWREIDSSKVPPELRQVVARLSYGTNATYFRTNFDSPSIVWRVDVQQPEHKKRYLVHTKELVTNGKTNVVIEHIDLDRPTK